MKFLLYYFGMFFCFSALLFIFCGFVINSSTAKCKMYGNETIVAAWQSKNEKGNNTIQAAIGSLRVLPSSWNLTTLSDELNAVENQNPDFFSNEKGDIVLLWEYKDEHSKPHLASATFRHDKNEWVVFTVAPIPENENFKEYQATIDETGKIVAKWISANSKTNECKSFVSEFDIFSKPTWFKPLEINSGFKSDLERELQKLEGLRILILSSISLLVLQ